MKKLLPLFLLMVIALQSCAVMRSDKVFILDTEEQEAVLQREFPDIYKLYREGRVSIDEMYRYKDRRKRDKYHVSYNYYIHVHHDHNHDHDHDHD